MGSGAQQQCAHRTLTRADAHQLSSVHLYNLCTCSCAHCISVRWNPQFGVVPGAACAALACRKGEQQCLRRAAMRTVQLNQVNRPTVFLGTAARWLKMVHSGSVRLLRGASSQGLAPRKWWSQVWAGQRGWCHAAGSVSCWPGACSNAPHVLELNTRQRSWRYAAGSIMELRVARGLCQGVVLSGPTGAGAVPVGGAGCRQASR